MHDFSMMDAQAKLTEFCQTVNRWPVEQLQLVETAERICRLFGFTFCAIVSPSIGDKIGMGFLDPSDAARVNSGVLSDFLKRQSHAVDELKQIEIPRDLVSRFNVESIRNLVIVPIRGELCADMAPSIGQVTPLSQKRVTADFGWIVVGTGKMLSADEEVILIAIVRRLAELAEIEKLESVIQARSQFLSIASHELKTPLTSIYGVLQLQERMLRQKKTEAQEQATWTEWLDRQQSYLKMVIRQVERLNELIDGLLNLSRIQNGRFIVEPTETDVSAVLKDVVASRLSIIGHEAGVKLSVEAPATLVAWVDPVRIEEVITNLVMNAIRFSPEGGVVWIRLREDGGSFQLIIRDQGPSVPMEDRERIFHPFERAQRTSRLGGLGLGLFISRQIAQLHGGNVSLVESVPGKGNVFEAHFPIRDVNLISA